MRNKDVTETEPASESAARDDEVRILSGSMRMVKRGSMMNVYGGKKPDEGKRSLWGFLTKKKKKKDIEDMDLDTLFA
jgi:hypothetical protein